MGTVYRVEHVALGRAVRAQGPARAASSSATRPPPQRFLREARTAARVRHPNIVDVFDFGHLADGRPYFVMELLEGESLADRARRAARCRRREVVTIARQLANALAAAHDRGVIHADVTPSNVLVVDAGDRAARQARRLRARRARRRGASTTRTPTSCSARRQYISPEQLRGLPADRPHRSVRPRRGAVRAARRAAAVPARRSPRRCA